MNKPFLLLTLFLLLSGNVFAEGSGKWQSPEHVPGAETVSVAQAQALHAGETVFIDVRNPRLFAKKHIPGAIHLDLKDGFNETNLASHVAKDQPVVLYCSGAKCSRSSTACTQAVAWGYTKVKYFREGVVGWKEAGLPMKWADGRVGPDPKYAR